MKNSLRIISQCALILTRKTWITPARSRLLVLVGLVGLAGLAAMVTLSTTSYAEHLVTKVALGLMQGKPSMVSGKATLATDKGSYLPGETITFTGKNWAP